MNAHDVIDILNELLAREQGQLAVRLAESTLFVSPQSVDEHLVVQRMTTDSLDHCKCLVAAITEFGGSPAHRPGHVDSADLHFQELHHVIPRLLVDHESLIQSYRRAAQRLAVEPRAAEVVGKILARHQADLDALRQLRTAPPAPPE